MNRAMDASQTATELPARIQVYLVAVDTALREAGAAEAERSDVLENVRAQILEMLGSRYGREEYSEEEIDAVLIQLDRPEAYAQVYMGEAQQSTFSSNGNGSIVHPPALPPRPVATLSLPVLPAVPANRNTGGTVMLVLLGVGLPVAALLFELGTRLCSFQFFNPIPTVAHAVCVGLVPAIYLSILVGLGRKTKYPRALLFACGIATGVSALYSIPFIPMAPFALIGILFFGLGLLPLAPISAFAAGLWLKRRIRLAAAESPELSLRKPFYTGLVLGVLLLVICYLPMYLVYSSIGIAAHGSGRARENALARLRFLGGEDEALRLAYRGSGRGAVGGIGLGPWSLVSAGSAVTQDDARKVYYRLTGKAFNSVPAPASVSGFFSPVSQFEREPDFRDGTVGVIDKSLTLASSRIDGVADAPSATAYVEWTMTFSNTSAAQREARSQILLPHGGVVSRLTLWVNGEEREAAFAERSRVSAAYERVVQRRQDPVLVTTAGPDRILVQCFPVPPSGGQMKIRLGITYPLAPQEKGEYALRLPAFLERNFAMEDNLSHSLWLESAPNSLSRVGDQNPGSRIAGQITDDELIHSSDFRITAGGKPEDARFADLREPQKYEIVQTVLQSPNPAPKSMILVVDSSAGVDTYQSRLIEASRRLPADMKVQLIVADEEAADGIGKTLSPRDLPDELSRIKFVGGRDNVPALERAWEAALQAPGATIVWVHGPQAVQLNSIDGLVQKLERTQGEKPPFYEVLVAPGPDRIIGELERFLDVKTVVGSGTEEKDGLTALFTRWKSGSPEPVITRERKELVAGAPALPSTSISGHVSRLWAFNEASNLFRRGRLADAVALAVKYQLVIPPTGAVVLENQQQYKEAGLDPVKPDTVPTIPEPEEWALIIVALLVLAFALFYRRSGRVGAFAG